MNLFEGDLQYRLSLRATLLLMTMTMLLLPSVVLGEPCTVCLAGPEKVPYPERQVGPDSQAPANTCQFIESSQGFIESGTEICDGIRSVGTMCGCNIPPDACTLCWDKSRVTSPNTLLPEYNVLEFIPASPEDTGPFSCESFESFWHTKSQNDPRCSIVQQQQAGGKCGCPPYPGNDNNNNSGGNTLDDGINSTDIASNVTINNDGNDNNKENNDESAGNGNAMSSPKCRVCVMGENVPLPEKELILGELPIKNCLDLEFFSGLIDDGTPECDGIQALGSYCGCSINEERRTCSGMCPNGQPPPKPKQKLNWFSEFVNNVPQAYQSVASTLTCDIMDAITKGGSGQLFELDDTLFCLSAQLKSWICGCEPDWRQRGLTWAYRGSGMLSLLGSGLIILDVLRKRKNRFTTYHQLVLGISLFDSIGSVAYLLVGVLAPYDAGFYLSRGNETTCRIQAFMIQLGQTSMYYNLCLALYFLLVISYNWKERQFRKLHLLTHVTVVSVGIGMATAANRYTGPQFGICSLLQPPATATWWPISAFFAVPVCIVLLTLGFATLTICRTVFRQQRKARKWRFDSNVSLTRKVFWQSFWYVMAFYATLPFLLLSYYLTSRAINIGMFMVVAIFAPSQGLMNALVYFQRSRGLKMFDMLWNCKGCCSGFVVAVVDRKTEETQRTDKDDGHSNNRNNESVASTINNSSLGRKMDSLVHKETIDMDASGVERDSHANIDNDDLRKGDSNCSSRRSSNCSFNDSFQMDSSKAIDVAVGVTQEVSHAHMRASDATLRTDNTKRTLAFQDEHGRTSVDFENNDEEKQQQQQQQQQELRRRLSSMGRQDSDSTLFSGVVEYWRLNECADDDDDEEEEEEKSADIGSSVSRPIRALRPGDRRRSSSSELIDRLRSISFSTTLLGRKTANITRSVHEVRASIYVRPVTQRVFLPKRSMSTELPKRPNILVEH